MSALVPAPSGARRNEMELAARPELLFCQRPQRRPPDQRRADGAFGQGRQRRFIGRIGKRSQRSAAGSDCRYWIRRRSLLVPMVAPIACDFGRSASDFQLGLVTANTESPVIRPRHREPRRITIRR